MKDISLLPDPCPLPDKQKKRTLNERERSLYAPLSGVGGILYDKVIEQYLNSNFFFYFGEVLYVIYQTLETVFHHISIRPAAEYF